MNLMDDDSDNDSDFVPEPEDDEISITGKRKNANLSIQEQILSKKRKRKVDSIWDELQEEERQYLESRRSLDATNFQEHVVMEIPCRKRTKRQISMLMHEVFGSTNLRDALPENRLKEGNVVNSEALKQAAKDFVSNMQKSVVVQETRRFAGQDVVIEKKVLKSQNEVIKDETTAANEEGKLDRLIETLKGPKAISTVTKSGADWEVYKEKEGIVDEELVGAKDGFIAKSAFLNSCDVASFEQEKSLRQAMRKN
jgi:hypothetical protein